MSKYNANLNKMFPLLFLYFLASPLVRGDDTDPTTSDQMPSAQIGPHFDGQQQMAPLEQASIAQNGPKLHSIPLMYDKTVQYYAEIGIGEPASYFLVMFDTRSPYLWVPSAGCTSAGCNTRRKYDSKLSTTYSGTNIDTLSDFSAGDHRITGKRSIDSLVLGPDLVVKNQIFIEAMIIKGQFLKDLPFDGIFGLRISNEFKSPLQNMVEQGIISKPVFSFYLNHNPNSPYSGQLTLGGINPEHYQGDITYVPLIKDDIWAIRIDRIELRRQHSSKGLRASDDANASTSNKPNIVAQACKNGCQAIIDTGSSFIGGHQADVELLNTKLGAKLISDGYYAIENCDMRKLPDLVLTLNGRDFSLKPEQYIISLDNEADGGGPRSCLSGIFAVDPKEYPFWVVGNYFIRNYYAVFDYEEKQVGFAKLADGVAAKDDGV